MNKNVFIVGFMLFAIFFGAGNLIFPPVLGLDSGSAFTPAIIGFVVTGVGLPLLSILVSINYKGGYEGALKKIHPVISLLLLVAIYLTIGPFFAIPRTAATAFDMAVIPFIGETSVASLLVFTVLYFGVTLWLSLNPSKMVDRIGAVLTPALLITIIALVVGMFLVLSGNAPIHTTTEFKVPFVDGILAGYQTMDVLAAFAFAVVVINAIKSKSENLENHSLVKQATLAAIVAAVALGVIYIAIGWIGNNLNIDATMLAQVKASGQNMGAYILNESATMVFGDLGRLLLGVMVTLACLSTSVGLVVATSQYFNSIFPRISYEVYAVIFTLISFGLANQGLNAVIAKSIPVLLVLYPIAITAMFVLLLNLVMPLPRLAQGLALIFVTVVSISSVAGLEFVANLPLKAYSMEWLPFAITGGVVGFIASKLVK